MEEKSTEEFFFSFLNHCAKKERYLLRFVLVDLSWTQRLNRRNGSQRLPNEAKHFAWRVLSRAHIWRNWICSRVESRDGYSHVYEASSIMFEVMRSSYYTVYLHACLKKNQRTNFLQGSFLPIDCNITILNLHYGLFISPLWSNCYEFSALAQYAFSFFPNSRFQQSSVSTGSDRNFENEIKGPQFLITSWFLETDCCCSPVEGKNIEI